MKSQRLLLVSNSVWDDRRVKFMASGLCRVLPLDDGGSTLQDLLQSCEKQAALQTSRMVTKGISSVDQDAAAAAAPSLRPKFHLFRSIAFWLQETGVPGTDGGGDGSTSISLFATFGA